MRKIFLGLLIIILLPLILEAQTDRWQQQVKYDMDIDFDVKSHQFKGKQLCTYTNNSPDTLHRVFYHLYFNAFQPGSMMDIRAKTIPDPSPRLTEDEISSLKPNEYGYHQVLSLTQDGKALTYEVAGTILEVKLNQPILPNSSSTFEMMFESQVPAQVRRNGRNNAEGIDYSMGQWYPKMCEYDYQGWHANPYIGREFHGVWGDFTVSITIDKAYTIGATGYLKNPEEIGHGYLPDNQVKQIAGDRLTWRFHAPNVHDFVWAADPDYVHKTFTRKDGIVLHFLYQEKDEFTAYWERLPANVDRAFDYINKNFGQYPYKQFSIIQGGDGGMEYPMSTLITGERPLGSLIGVTMHELMHSWYQGVLATNESLYSWMDEGFVEYAETKVKNFLREEGLMGGERVKENIFQSFLDDYISFNETGLEEPLSIHADHFITNSAYARASYTKGAVFLIQLGYIIGEKALAEGMLRYFYDWKFKHPNANDFIRVMEKTSGIELDWYKEYMVNSTHTIDYGIYNVTATEENTTQVILFRKGFMPMPVDVQVTYRDGRQEIINIALRIMRGNKPQEDSNKLYRIEKDWTWTNPVYELVLPEKLENIQKIEILHSNRLADVDTANNIFEVKR